MKKLANLTGLFLLIAMFLPAMARAADVVIPTTVNNPFDQTQGIFEVSYGSNNMRVNSDNEIENGRNGCKATFTLDNREDADYYLLCFKAGTTRSDAQFHIAITADDGTAACNTTIALVNNGTWTANRQYTLKTGKMEKGHYTLVFDFISTGNEYVARLADIAFKKPISLKPGDEVEILNPEFDNGLNGWTRQGGIGSGNNTYMFGNNSGVLHFNSGTAQLSQNVIGLPDGVYLLRLNAYDSYPNDDDPDTYVFLGDREVPMKTAFDDALSYRNIWRWYGSGLNNQSYRSTGDGRYVPTHNHAWNETLAMAERLYENCVVATITSGMASFGWRKTGNRATRVVFDHARLIYLSDDVRQQYSEAALITQHLRERLASLVQSLRTELVANRQHAPQAVSSVNAFIDAEASYQTDGELLDAILQAEHLVQRLALNYYEVAVPSGSTSGLAELLTEKGIQPADTFALKLSGTLTSDDLAALKTYNNMMELDLSETTLTALPDNQFNNKFYLLTWLALPRQRESIGSRTFFNCVELRDLQLPPTLKSIGEGAFYYTYNFCSAIIPEGLTVAGSAYHDSGLRHLVLPSSMAEVPFALCCSCHDLFDVKLNGQKVIGQSAFENCYSLRTIDLPEGIERLAEQCFRYCIKLNHVVIPSTVTRVERPFFNCSALKDLTCLTFAPPYANNQSLHGDMSSAGCRLRVPLMSVAAYEQADWWKNFDIEGIDVLPQTIQIVSPLSLDMQKPLSEDYLPDVTLSGLYSYWGGNVASVPTLGTLTVEGPVTFSAGRLTTLYNGFARWSMANRDGQLPSHTSIINHGTMRADNVTIDLRLYENCWEFVSFPFDVRVGNIRSFFPNTPLAIYSYDAQKRAEGKKDETWVPLTADSMLHAGRGYIFNSVIPYDQQADRQRDYMPNGHYNWHFNRFFIDAEQNANKPKFFRTDDVEVTLQKYESEYAHDRSWNFIGNPYPCYFDIQKMETTAPIIVWTYRMTHIAGSYRAYSPLDDDLILLPGQAFFIQCPLDHDKLVFHKEGRQHDLALHYDVAQARAMKAHGQGKRQVFNLLLSGDEGNDAHESIDRTRFVINEAASLDYEPGRDACKFFSLDADATQLYTMRGGVQYAIDERPLDNGEVVLGLKIGTEGCYTLSLGSTRSGEQDEEVVLVDHETGTQCNLSTDSYTFQAVAGTHEGRFSVRLGSAAITSVQCDATMSQPAGQLFDLQGRPVSHPQAGIYVRDNKKVIIK